jgi:Xaa-Pro aminopeptidase
MKRSILSLILLFPGILGGILKAQTLDPEVFTNRRQEVLSQMDENSIALFKAPVVSMRNSDIAYPYRTSSDFYYLTGFEEPGSAFLLVPGAKHPFIMFVQPAKPEFISFVGKRTGILGVMEEFGADTAFAFNLLEKMIPEYIAGKKPLYLHSSDMDFRDKVKELVKQSENTESRIRIKPIPHLQRMRMIKKPEEIVLMRKACEITGMAIMEVLRTAEPGMWEYELQAVLEYVYRKNGSPRVGFSSIIGSGSNSVILHYKDNNCQTRDGDIVCMDVGAEYGYYSADITRSFPINGTFSESQMDIYEIVLKANKDAIDLSKPGVDLGDVYAHAVDVIRDGLFDLGLIADKDVRWQTRMWLPHGIGHFLGMDPHDVGGYMMQGVILKPGMVFTVEPGIYIQQNALDYVHVFARNESEEAIQVFIEKVRPAVEKYQNVGIRIEDDILITESGYENLSAGVPKETGEIETMMAEESILFKD